MMGTRSGSVDPGILVYLVRQKGISAERLDEILNKESGLLGISGISGDMRQILAAVRNGNEREAGPDGEADSLAASLEGRDACPFESASGQEQAERVRAAVQRLPDFLRQVLIMAYYQGMKYREVAEALDIARDVARKLIDARREREGAPNLPTTNERRDYTIVVAA